MDLAARRGDEAVPAQLRRGRSGRAARGAASGTATALLCWPWAIGPGSGWRLRGWRVGLSEIVPSPALDRAGVADRAGVGGTGADGGKAAGRGVELPGVDFVGHLCLCVPYEPVVASPALDLAAPCTDRAGMHVAAGGADGGKRAGRGRGVVRRASYLVSPTRAGRRWNHWRSGRSGGRWPGAGSARKIPNTRSRRSRAARRYHSPQHARR